MLPASILSLISRGQNIKMWTRSQSNMEDCVEKVPCEEKRVRKEAKESTE